MGDSVRDMQRKLVAAARDQKTEDSDRAALSGKPLLRDEGNAMRKINQRCSDASTCEEGVERAVAAR